MNDRNGSTQGMTLLEILMAGSILVIALFGLFSALIGGQSVTGQSRERAQAALAAASKLEEIMARPWNGTGSLESLITTPMADEDVRMEIAPGVFSRLTPVTGQTKTLFVTVTDTALTDLRQVRVRVRWKAQRGGADTELNMYALVARH